VKHLRYAITLTILLTSIICLGQKPKHAVAEQTSFCEDGADDLELKPVALPRLVLATVMNTKEGRDAQRELSQSEGTERDPTRLLKEKEIRLSDSGNRFFLVMGHVSDVWSRQHVVLDRSPKWAQSQHPLIHRWELLGSERQDNAGLQECDHHLVISVRNRDDHICLRRQRIQGATETFTS
jgi:hypothetical protein